MKPISPSEVDNLKAGTIPDEVIDEFNKMIAAKWNGSSAKIIQDEIVSAVASRMEISRNEIYENKWMDVEHLFRQAGWKVSYDKPAYYETYDAYFIFAK